MRRVAFERITSIANELARDGDPDRHELVKDLIAAVSEALRESLLDPLPIETAPKEPSRGILLYCPDQGGWQIGRWAISRWLSTRKVEFLEPTHWAETPAEPQSLKRSPERDDAQSAVVIKLQRDFGRLATDPNNSEAGPAISRPALAQRIAEAQSRLEAALRLPGLERLHSHRDGIESAA